MKNNLNVIIVGRTNVGKSSIFNRISLNIKSIVLDQEGVTRDAISEIVEWSNTSFNLIDTGGISIFGNRGEIESQVYKKIINMLENAFLILFVCDGQVGITNEDSDIAKYLHKLNKDVVLIINKVDNEEMQNSSYQFNKLGFKKMFFISAQHAKGIADLLDFIVYKIKSSKNIMQNDDDSEFKITILGKPNSGKSSLINLLVNEEFSIVSDIEGTTREALRKKINFNKSNFELIDTPGIRRKSSINTEIEKMMVRSTLSSVKRSNLVLLLINLEDPHLTNQDLKLADQVFESGAALILLFNKYDLIDQYKESELKSDLDKYDFLLKKLDKLFISCKDKKNIGKILPMVEKVKERYYLRISEEKLTDIFFNHLKKTPFYRNGVKMLFYKARQVGGAPMRIELTVKNKELYQERERACFENILRNNYDLKSVPIIFYFTEKE